MNQHSEIETEGGDMFTTKQIKELQKRNAPYIIEENQILKKAITIFTPHSNKD